MRTTRRRFTIAAIAALGSGLLLTGCAAPAEPAPTAGAERAVTPTPSSTSTAAATTASVAGYDVGQFPPVPMFTMPDISMLDASLGGFSFDLSAKVTPRPGLDIRPAPCGDMVQRAAGRSSSVLYGDGSGTYTGPDGEKVNYGDGSGTFTANGVTSTVYGDGSGSFESPALTIHNYGDGSGSVTDASGETHVYGDGSGSFLGGGVQHWNYGDGSAMYDDGTVEIHNYGDGSGSYQDDSIEIHNYGDGTGRVNSTDVKVDPIAAEAPIGKFPPMGALAPITSCGTVITLEDGVLFDFAKHDVRPDASAVLDQLAAALNELGVANAEVSGHTDSIGSEDDNQVLSEQRATAVVDALRQRKVTGTLTATGYGESAPVAANEVDGHDNPAGRQLNRRVEIFVPAS